MADNIYINSTKQAEQYPVSSDLPTSTATSQPASTGSQPPSVAHRAVSQPTNPDESLNTAFKVKVDQLLNQLQSNNVDLKKVLALSTLEIDPQKLNFLFPEEIDTQDALEVVLLDDDKNTQLLQMLCPQDGQYMSALKSFRSKLTHFIKDELAYHQLKMLHHKWQLACQDSGAQLFFRRLVYTKPCTYEPESIELNRINAIIAARNIFQNNLTKSLEQGLSNPCDFQSYSAIYTDFVETLKAETAKYTQLETEKLKAQGSFYLYSHCLYTFLDFQPVITRKPNKLEQGNLSSNEVSFMQEVVKCSNELKTQISTIRDRLTKSSQKFDEVFKVFKQHFKSTKDKMAYILVLTSILFESRIFRQKNPQSKVQRTFSKAIIKSAQIDWHKDCGWMAFSKLLLNITNAVSQDAGAEDEKFINLFKKNIYKLIDGADLTRLNSSLEDNSSFSFEQSTVQLVDLFHTHNYDVDRVIRYFDYKIEIMKSVFYPFFQETGETSVLEYIGLSIHVLSLAKVDLVIAKAANIVANFMDALNIEAFCQSVISNRFLTDFLEEQPQLFTDLEVQGVLKAHVKLLDGIEKARLNKLLFLATHHRSLSMAHKSENQELAQLIASFILSLNITQSDSFFNEIYDKVLTQKETILPVLKNILETVKLSLEIKERNSEVEAFERRFNEVVYPTLEKARARLEHNTLSKEEKEQLKVQLIEQYQQRQKKLQADYRKAQEAKKQNIELKKAEQRAQEKADIEERKAKRKERKDVRKAEKLQAEETRHLSTASEVPVTSTHTAEEPKKSKEGEEVLTLSIEERKARKALLKSLREKKAMNTEGGSISSVLDQSAPKSKQPIYCVLDNHDDYETYVLLTSKDWKTVSYSQKEILNLIRAFGGYQNQGNGGSHVAFSIPSFDKLMGQSTGCPKTEGMCTLVAYQKKEVPEYQLRQIRNLLVEQLGYTQDRVVSVMPEVLDEESGNSDSDEDSGS